MTLERIMLETWKKVREILHYPDLPAPKLVDNINTACINMIDHQISVSKKFAEKFHENGVSYETIFTGLLAHEVNHYMTCPFDLARSVWIDILARRADENIAEKASALYIDLVNNLDLIMRKDVKEVAELLRTQPANSALEKVIKAYYQKATKEDMNLDMDELDDFMKAQLERIFAIDFFDTANEGRNVTRFTRIIRDIIKQYNIKDIAQPMGDFTPEAYNKNEIAKALKDLAKKLKKDEFEKAARILMGCIGKKAGKEKRKNEERPALYYQQLAENYPVQLKKRKIKENGTLYPHSHKEFEIDDNPQDIDIYASLGKPFIPGLGKVWVKKQGTHYAQKETTPNALIMRDVSGSMCSCNPYAETACIAAANAYLDNGSKTAVYLFNTEIDETELAKGFQTDKESIHTALAKSNSGGTTINKEALEKLEETIKKSEKELDIVLVTDLEIDGREELFKFLHERRAHRVTIIYTGKNGGIEELQKKYNSANFTLYHITKPEDIPTVILGEVGKSI
jgi:hypothetical protein